MAVKKAAAKKKKAAKKPGKTGAGKAVKKAAKRLKKTAVKKKIARKAVKKAAKKASPPRPATQPRPQLSPAVKKRNEMLTRLLLKKRNEVVGNLESQMGRKLIREAGQKIDSAMDSADLSALDMDQGIDYSLLEMKYEQYKDIADAFRKLQNNTYGLCEECGEEIDIKRLEVTPLARYCISCKTKKEELERIQKEETRFKE
jgi:RNA polymerase-binding transcription factor